MQYGASLHTYVHPLRGKDGEELALDIAVFGQRGSKVLLVTSGCHGVEGYCGSGIQLAALNDQLVKSAYDAGVTLVLAHALNPYGFSFGRRVNEDNVDLNRNFHDFAQPLPVNEGYAPLHELLIPSIWPPPVSSEALLREQFQTRGMPYMQGAITAGQFTHLQGLHYSGKAPVWSHLQTRRLLKEHCSYAAHFAWIDLHSGLGPSGVGERIFSPCYTPENSHVAPAMWQRANDWWAGGGATPLTQVGKDSASTNKIRGNLNASALWECLNSSITKVTLEFGTLPPLVVLQAMRAEQWLQLHPQTDTTVAEQIRQDLKNAFYVDTPQWRSAVVQQGLEAIEQAISGLSREQ
jgi:predicted deacylase